MTTTTATVTVNADGTAILDLADGQPLLLHTDSLDEARKQSIAMIIGHARSAGQTVTVLARDPDAEHLLEILPDGTVSPAPTHTMSPGRSAFAPPDDDPCTTSAAATPQAPPAAEGPTSNPVLPAEPTPPAHTATPGQGPAQRHTPVVLLPPEPPATPASNTRSRAWPLAAAGAVGMGTAAALWLWPHGSTAPTMSTAPTAPTASAASNADTAPTPAPEAITLGATTTARSEAPRPVRLSRPVTPVAWDGAATWQARRDRRTAAQPPTGWTQQVTGAPASPTNPYGQTGAPTGRAPAAPSRPDVVINPDPAPEVVLKPDPAPPAPKQPAGPALPDQPANPINPD